MNSSDAPIPFAEPASNPDIRMDEPDVPTHGQSDGLTSPTKASAEPVTATALEIGRALAGYRLLAKLGEGGMGAVFIAEDLALHRQVALKVMQPKTAAKASAKERFFREARAAARLENDYIVPVYQVGEDAGVPFLAMQLLKGESLGRRLRREQRSTLAFLLLAGRHIALGLAAAHEKGLIHRDIKPDNIWIEPLPSDDAPAAERCKILDFGLARPAQLDQELLTQEGDILGTPAYMAPEQGRGEPVDHRADLFSLGCVLYEMASGRRAFKGNNTLEILTSLAVDRPVEPGALNPLIPPALSALIMSLLEKDPARRPASARQIAEAIRKLEVCMLQKAQGNLSTRGAGSPARPTIAAARRHGPDAANAKPPLARDAKNRGLVILAALAALAAAGVYLGNHERWFLGGKSKSAETTAPVKLADDVDDNPPLADFALSFDGKSVVDIPTLNIDPANDFTIEAIIIQGLKNQGLQTPLSSANRFILRGGRTWSFGFLGAQNEVAAQNSARPIVPGQRTHVAGVVSAGQARLYVNGNLVALTNFDASKPTTNIAGVFEIGQGFHGLIDEVRISSIARYTQKFTPARRFKPDQYTQALYHFDEARGDTLKDSSGNGHQGQITGARWAPTNSDPSDE